MPTFAETVRDHYQAGIKDETELLTRLNRIIDEIELPLTAEKFAAFDQFHAGGLAATVELGKRAEITRDMRALDAGSRLGGPSRFLAETIGCSIRPFCIADQNSSSAFIEPTCRLVARR